jgi:hypothetical protein
LRGGQKTRRAADAARNLGVHSKDSEAIAVHAKYRSAPWDRDVTLHLDLMRQGEFSSAPWAVDAQTSTMRLAEDESVLTQARIERSVRVLKIHLVTEVGYHKIIPTQRSPWIFASACAVDGLPNRRLPRRRE